METELSRGVQPPARAAAPHADPMLPTYRRLYEHYRQQILTYQLQPGERMASINEVRAEHGVGRETAKRVLSLLAEDGYVVLRRGRGTFVAERRACLRALGLLLPHYSLQYEELIRELSRFTAAAGRAFHHFCHYNNYEEEIRIAAKMLREGYEAVAVIPSLDESRAWRHFYSKLQAERSKVIWLDHTMSSNSFDYVVQSYDLGVTRAMGYLMRQKSGNIAFVENEMWPGRNMVLELMRGTYLEVLRRQRPQSEPTIYSRPSCIDAAHVFERGLTGVFCCDDIGAMQVVGRLKAGGVRVPEDVNVVGYGNTELGRLFTPPVSTVDPCTAQMALTLCQMLFAADGEPGDGVCKQHVVQPLFVARET